MTSSSGALDRKAHSFRLQQSALAEHSRCNLEAKTQIVNHDSTKTKPTQRTPTVIPLGLNNQPSNTSPVHLSTAYDTALSAFHKRISIFRHTTQSEQCLALMLILLHCN